MKIFNWNNLSETDFSFFEKGSALTIGSFDGPHKGHESLFVSVLDYAKENQLVPGIITFTQALPGVKHPVNYAGDLATLRQRLFQYEKKGFQFVVVIQFDERFSHTSGEEFFKILIEKLNLKFISEGLDFRCGFKGLCGIQEITNYSFQYGFEARFMNLVLTDGQRISSSSIRQLVQKGDFKLVNELLERNYQLEFNESNSPLILKSDEKNVFRVQKSKINQVLPECGSFTVLVNDSEIADFCINKDIAEIRMHKGCLIEKIETVDFLSE